eukprot:jgi/Hompol1/5690/HPOL_000817-RA
MDMNFKTSSKVLCQAEEAAAKHRQESTSNQPAHYIPRIIHQQWKSAELPSVLTREYQQFDLKGKDHLHLLWSDDDLSQFVRKHYPRIAGLYDNLPQPIMRADLARYLLLFSFGGVYSDLDTYPVRDVENWADPYTDQAKMIVGIEVDTTRVDWHDWYARSLQFCQWTMASVPKHPVMRSVVGAVIYSLVAQLSNGTQNINVVETTGPGPWSDSIMSYLGTFGYTHDKLRNLQQTILVGDVVVLPITGFSPGVRTMGAQEKHHHEARLVHQFYGSWKPNHNPNFKLSF